MFPRFQGEKTDCVVVLVLRVWDCCVVRAPQVKTIQNYKIMFLRISLIPFGKARESCVLAEASNQQPESNGSLLAELRDPMSFIYTKVINHEFTTGFYQIKEV